jgi:GrpB-like predicted nucleotidyltransferase (UPF0157 family)
VITVVDYDPAWPRVFEELRDRYEVALRGVEVFAIEHVGSTSVPGLAAKPVIDVDIIVAREHLADAIAALGLAGFRSLGERGIPDRWALDVPSGLPRDTDSYVEAKSTFLSTVLERAGLTSEERRIIEDANRTT